MRGIRNAVLWVVAPGYISWEAAGRRGEPPWRAIALHGSTRLLLAGCIVLLAVLGEWVGVALLAIAFGLMVAGSIGLHLLLERAARPGSGRTQG
jgi:hypothetical protein